MPSKTLWSWSHGSKRHTFDCNKGFPSAGRGDGRVVLPVADKGAQCSQQEATGHVLPVMPVVLHVYAHKSSSYSLECHSIQHWQQSALMYIRYHDGLNMIAIIGTSDHCRWLAEACKMLRLLTWHSTQQ